MTDKPRLTITVTDKGGNVLDKFEVTSVREKDTERQIVKLVRELHEFEFDVYDSGK